MRLYHYTGREHVPGIEKQGIFPGAAFAGLGDFITRGVWLTRSDDWQQQIDSWATMETLDCDRSEARVAVDIGPLDRLLWPWELIKERLSLAYPLDVLMDFERPGAEHWKLYLGHIPRESVDGIEYRPAWIHGPRVPA